MKYPLYCDCGKAYEVAASVAGTAFPCGCGRTVAVPKLSTLRESVGYAENPADYQLWRAIQDGHLPDDHCLMCEAPTAHVRDLVVTCRLTYVLKPKEFQIGSVGMLAGLMNWLSRNESKPRPDIIREFALPLRVCKECNLDLEEEKAVRAALSREPMYAALFKRYTDTSVRDAR